MCFLKYTHIDTSFVLSSLERLYPFISGLMLGDWVGSIIISEELQLCLLVGREVFRRLDSFREPFIKGFNYTRHRQDHIE